MQPLFADYYTTDEESVKVRVDHFEDRTPVVWLEVNNMFSVSLDKEQTEALADTLDLVVTDIQQDSNEIFKTINDDPDTIEDELHKGMNK